MSSLYRRMTEPPDQPVNKLLDAPTVTSSGASTPPKRSQSPYQPPPLTSLSLQHDLPSTQAESLLLTRSLAEEIRLLIPPRLQLLNNWRLAYSLEIHGSSLATLYEHAANMTVLTQRSGYVLVVKDGSSASAAGSMFGAYLTDAPKPAMHYYGTGECFLWRASILPTLQNIIVAAKANGNGRPSKDLLELAGLPPPPSADTTNVSRTTTIKGQRRSSQPSSPTSPRRHTKDNSLLQPPALPHPASGTSTPDRIRFKAFPYSGMNDFMIYCTQDFLSVGGGDGHYGLWLDDTLDNGISETCPTFGNEPLSEEGRKFEILDVEMWYVGS
jgi:TLD